MRGELLRGSPIPKIHLNDIDHSIEIDHRSNKPSLTDPITPCSTTSNSPKIPPPTKFTRNAKQNSDLSLSHSYPRAQRSGAIFDTVYKLHRKHIQTMIMEEHSTTSAVSPTNPSPLLSEWSVWDSTFSME